MTEKDNCAVQVAVRIRPLVDNEKSRGCENILEVYKDIQQIKIKNSDKAFTFNHVFDTDATQDNFYDTCIKDMIGNLFKGYHMTILAYGQTGSGKTYSMGTSYNGDGDMGVIPRAINDIFNYAADNFAYDFTISVSFMELYQEVLYDLLGNKSRDQCVLEIREDTKGSIIIPGLTEEAVTSAKSTLDCLSRGSLGRATGSTNMNLQSSRSHAIFTINICMQRKDDCNLNKTAKFHLVDLAGSERSKKTGATGVTFREGVDINKGLLALGNVISALGDEKYQGFIGYRNSNLTRLLKDALGGNSITLMIACVSPADYNVEESLSTLRYADRARKIKNKPVVNQDPKAAEINRLNKLVQQLRLELMGSGGPIICQSELDQIKKENVCQKLRLQELMGQLSSTINEKTVLIERVMLLQASNEELSKKLIGLKDQYNITIDNLNHSLEEVPTAAKEHLDKLQAMKDVFSDICKDSQKVEEQIRIHERNNNSAKYFNKEIFSETELSEKQEIFTKQQIALNSELQEITQTLAMKEHLAEQMAQNVCNMVNWNDVAETEKKVSNLQKERDELLQQLKNAQMNVPGNKVAEQRRKRVQELEKEIHDLHKKITELTRLVKLKEKDETKIKQLNVEIQNMKATKVKLIKNMKHEAEQFRTWKLQRERELIKLKDQDRKRQNQLMKLETQHSRQQNVLKRKIEEVAAINKRLKDVLAVRNNIHEQKHIGKVERLGPWIQHELEIFISTVDAEATLPLMLEDRATLTQQLEQLKSNPELADPNEIERLNDEIELRSSHIQDLQQKIIDSNQDHRTKSRWDNIQTMSDAKYALKAIFELTADIRRRDIEKETKINEFQNAQTDTQRKLAKLEIQIQSMKAQHEHELSSVSKEAQEKISVLLRQLRDIPLEGIDAKQQQQLELQQIKFQSKLVEVKDEYEQQINDLKLKYEDTQATINEIQVATLSGFVRKDSKEAATKPHSQNHIPSPNSELNVSDDTVADPDWRNTPLAKRVRRLRSNVSESKNLPVKRNSDGSCTCKRDCSKRSCGCKSRKGRVTHFVDVPRLAALIIPTKRTRVMFRTYQMEPRILSRGRGYSKILLI